MNIYSDDNLEKIATAIIEFRDKKINSVKWKQNLKDDFENGTNKNEYLQQFRNKFDFINALKGISPKSTKDSIIRVLKKNIF